MGVTETLARFAVETRLQDVPRDIVDTAKLRILDTLGVMIGGSVEECTRMALAVMEEAGGKPEANIAGHRLRNSRLNAAFVNGVAAHALDYDDLPLNTPNHISVTALPPPLALGEALGAGGRDVLLAYILAYEIEARIGRGMGAGMYFRGFQPQGILGCLGAAVGAAKVLGLDVEQTRRALGIAGSAASGIIKHYGTMTKPFVIGNACRNGIMAALLSARGYTAPLDVLDTGPGKGYDRFGFCETFGGEGNYSLERMTDGLGESWELPTAIIKHHPGSTPPFLAIDATLNLVIQNDIKPEEVEHVDVAVLPFTMNTQCGPRPRDGVEARYSIWYNVAISVLDRQSGLRQYTNERVSSPDVSSFLDRVSVRVDPDVVPKTNKSPDLFWLAAEVTIRLKDGRAVSEKREGYPAKDMDWENVVEKYLECAEYADLPKKGVDVRRGVDLVQELEHLPKVEDLLRSLTPGDPN